MLCVKISDESYIYLVVSNKLNIMVSQIEFLQPWLIFTWALLYLMTCSVLLCHLRLQLYLLRCPPKMETEMEY